MYVNYFLTFFVKLFIKFINPRKKHEKKAFFSALENTIKDLFTNIFMISDQIL